MRNEMQLFPVTLVAGALFAGATLFTETTRVLQSEKDLHTPALYHWAGRFENSSSEGEEPMAFAGLPVSFPCPRRLTVLGMAIILLAAFPTCSGENQRPRKNVLLITLDTTRVDRLGCFGHSSPTSPNLDALARQSVLFELAISQAAVTPVAHASILTGLDPHHHGLRVLHGLVENTLPPDCVTLAELWRESGGRTAAFVSAYPVTEAFGLEQGFEVFDAHFARADGEGLTAADGTVNAEASQRSSEATTTGGRTASSTRNRSASPSSSGSPATGKGSECGRWSGRSTSCPRSSRARAFPTRGSRTWTA